ncbi:MAG: type II secretion system F family protein [Rhodomicrobium sp.]
MTEHLIPLFAASFLASGGLLFVLYAVRNNRGLPARRLSLVQGQTETVDGRLAGQTFTERELQSCRYAVGLNNDERRQVVRSFAKLGLSASHSLLFFTAARLALAATAPAISLFIVRANSPLLPMLVASVSGIAGWLLPGMFIRMKLKNHGHEVGAGLPDALELLAVCVGAGLSLESALQRVSLEVKVAQPALADELALTWAEICILPNRDQALANLAKRVNLPAVRSVIGTLSQSLRFGTPLAQSLRSAANEMRNRELTELEEKANRLPAMLTAR